jgi:methyl-accepting chemotaxis protein
MNRLPGFFLKEYEKLDYLNRTRAVILFWFELSFVFFTFLMQFSMLFAGWFDFLVTIPISLIMLVGAASALSLLRSGKYLYSANVFITFATITVIAGLIRQPFQEIELSYTSYIYLLYPCIAMCAVFSTIRFLTIISLFIAIADIALFVIMRLLSVPESSRMITIAFNNSLFCIGFLYLIAFLIIRVFERSMNLANQEARKNSQSNRFIKHVLAESSNSVVSAMQSMSDQSDEFSENTHDQAAAIEEISATIEELSAGIDSVSMIAHAQNESLSELVQALSDLSDAIIEIDRSIGESLNTAGEISEKARSGEQYLRIMEEGIGKIRESSTEMSAILGMIHDISDKINLLSLNAAIEAARAGDAGRGFAVVADEISKLADETATSLKGIESLIKTNENEIQRGLSGVTMSVNITMDIIDGISEIHERIQSMNQYKDRQSSTNTLVNSSTSLLKRRSEDITSSTATQKQAIAEIADHMNAMSERAQSTTAFAVKMAYESRNLVDMVIGLRRKLDEYRE